jgi:hypothetical protein
VGASVPTAAQDVAAALVVAYRAKHGAEPSPNAIVLPLAQLMGEGSLSKYFLGTNNLGAMHATTSFAARHAHDAGYGMVAFLDHAPGPRAYITRMAVYPSLAAGARALLALLERMVDHSTVADVGVYAAQLYAHGFYEGTAEPATPIAARAAAQASGAWTAGDRANIAAYAGLISQNLPAAGRAFDSLASYAGDPSAVTSGPPFAPLADRLTPAPAYAPHTLEHARALLAQGASSPAIGLSLDDVLAAPGGDGVWLFGELAAAPEVAAGGGRAPMGVRSGAEGFAIAGALLAAAAIASAIAPPNWPATLWKAAA